MHFQFKETKKNEDVYVWVRINKKLRENRVLLNTDGRDGKLRKWPTGSI